MVLFPEMPFSELALSFLTLTFLEVILGIDNLVFISILSEKLSPRKRKMAQQLGLSFALLTRVLFLSLISWIVHLTTPLFSIFGFSPSWKDLILIGGGGFLIVKATLEIHDKVENEFTDSPHIDAKSAVAIVITQIALMDIIFSIDSIITAVGMARHLGVMIGAVFVSMVAMIMAVSRISQFISENPTIKMLALSFLLLIGMALVAEGVGFEIPKGYLYFAILFSLFVEFLNTLVRTKAKAKDKPLG